MRIVLASGSPRRAELLRQLGLTFEVVVPDVDETRLDGESPKVYVERVTRTKGGTVADADAEALVIAADTVVVVDGEILGKPGSVAEAVAMLTRLQGRTHVVHTGLWTGHGDRRTYDVGAARVTMTAMAPPTIRRYVATGEPLDKAGAYALQGVGGQFVARVDGDPTAVVGLPLPLLRGALAAHGVEPLDVAAT